MQLSEPVEAARKTESHVESCLELPCQKFRVVPNCHHSTRARMHVHHRLNKGHDACAKSFESLD